MKGIAATGNAIDFTGVSILTIHGGKIGKQRNAYDHITFLVQARVMVDRRS